MWSPNFFVIRIHSTLYLFFFLCQGNVLVLGFWQSSSSIRLQQFNNTLIMKTNPRWVKFDHNSPTLRNSQLLTNFLTVNGLKRGGKFNIAPKWRLSVHSTPENTTINDSITDHLRVGTDGTLTIIRKKNLAKWPISKIHRIPPLNRR